MANDKGLTKEQTNELWLKCLNTFLLNGGGVQLWTNSSPNSSFSPQTITGLTYLSYYKYIIISYVDKCNDSKTNKIERIMYNVGSSAYLNSIIQTSSESLILSRQVKIASNSSIQFYDCYNNNAVSNSYLVPITIYGCNDMGYSNASSTLDSYPVGSIYMSVNSTSPANLFGGTWTQLKDTFILAAGDTYSNGATGGAATHNHTLGSSYAKIAYYWDGTKNTISLKAKLVESFSFNRKTFDNLSGYNEGTYNDTIATELGGTTDNSSNMPPYLVAYVWKRTA